MSRSARFFGFDDANAEIMRLARIIMTLVPIIVVTVTMSTTFYIIFIADALGGGEGMYLQGMALVGVLVVIQLVTQTLLDYPTGVLGDWIGQRFVIASAYICYAIVFFLTSLVTTETPFTLLILIYILTGVAASQESGAWGAWFDNNYRYAMPKDTDRKQYGVFQGRMGMVFTLVATASLIPGSILAVLFGRAWVFQLEAIVCFVVAIIVLKIVRDFPEVEAAREERPSMTAYVGILKAGASFLFSNPFIKWLILGGMMLLSAIITWGNLILFPLYFSYLLTDVAVASFRTILFIPGVVSQERSGVWSQRFEPKKWIPRFRLLQTCGFVFFMVIAFVMYIFPPVIESMTIVDVFIPFTTIVIMSVAIESLLPILLLLLTFVFTGFFSGFADILTMRILLDVIPNKIRNSVYSLIPTVAMIFAIPQIIIIGATIQYLGFPISLVLCAFISLLGVLMVRKGLSYPIPIKQDDIGTPPQEEPETVEDDLQEIADET